jgi:hypothetical protein
MGRVYETAILIGAKLSATFKSQTYSASEALKRLGVEAKKLSAAERASESFVRVTANLKDATEKYNTTAEAVARLAVAEKAAGGPTRESIKWRKAGERALKTAAREFDRASRAAGANAAALHRAGVDTSKLTQEQTRLAAALAVTERKQKALAQVAEAHGRIFGRRGLTERIFGDPKQARIDKLGEQLGGIFNDVKRLGIAGVGAAVGIFEVAKSTAEAGTDIEKTAIRLGTTTDALQLLRGAAGKSNVDVEALDIGLGKMAVNIGKVISAKKKGGAGGLVGEVGGIQLLGTGKGGGAGAQVDPFKHLGLDAKDLAKQKPEEQVGRISDAINKLKTHSEKAAASVQIFGKGGLALLPLIEKGSAGQAELFAQIRASGNLLSADTIENSKRFHLALLASEGALKSVKNTLGAALLPVVTDVLGKFTAFVQENRAEIKAWAEKLATWIQGKAIPAVVKFGGEALDLAKKVASLIQRGADLVGGFGNLAAVVAALRLAPVAKSILDISAAAIKGAIGLAKYVAAKWSAVAATKALNAAESAGGLQGAPAATGKSIGTAANATMIAAAAAIGYEIGTKAAQLLDDQFQLTAKLDKVQEDAAQAKSWTDVFGLKGGLGLGAFASWSANRDREEQAQAAEFLRKNHPRGAAAAQVAANAQAAKLAAQGPHALSPNLALAEGGGPAKLGASSARGGGVHIGQLVLQHGGDPADPQTAKEFSKQLGAHVDAHQRRKKAEERRLSYG